LNRSKYSFNLSLEYVSKPFLHLGNFSVSGGEVFPAATKPDAGIHCKTLPVARVFSYLSVLIGHKTKKYTLQPDAVKDSDN